MRCNGPFFPCLRGESSGTIRASLNDRFAWPTCGSRWRVPLKVYYHGRVGGRTFHWQEFLPGAVATMNPATVFRVTYWGVTGSYPRPMSATELQACWERVLDQFVVRHGQATVAAALPSEAQRARLFEQLSDRSVITFGGDTTCIQITAGKQLFIVDAGSGLHRLSQQLGPPIAGGLPWRGTLFLTHPHYDHLCALPFFEPFYDARSEFILRASQRALDALESIGHPTSALAGVFLPQTAEQLPGLKLCAAIEAGESLQCGDVRVSTLALNHPGGSLAYRFDRAGKAIVIATDHEQPESPDRALAEFAQGAELLYMDAQYLRDEYDGLAGVAGDAPQSRVGWGHTPLEDCIPTAIAAGVKRLHLGHHEPRRNDAALHQLAERARHVSATALRASSREVDSLQVELAYQGMTVDV